jgi:hypothetical protein
MNVRWIAVVAGLLALGPGCKKQQGSAPPDDAPRGEAADPDGEADEDAPAAAEPAEEESPYLDAMNFNRVVEANIAAVVACWKDTAGKDAAPPKGRIKTTVVVDGDGKVKDVQFDPQRSTLKHDALNACVKQVVSGLKFNITLNGADSPMPYTFDLTDGGLLK